METFGQKVRYAVESQGLPLDELARATGLGIDQIQALERDDFGALHGDEIVIEGLRSLAMLIQVDPDEVIADYGRERRRWLEARSIETGLVREPEPRIGPGRMRRVTIFVSTIIGVLVIALLYLSRTPTARDSTRPQAAPEGVATREPAVETRNVPGTPAAMPPPTQEQTPPPDTIGQGSAFDTPTGAPVLSIRRHGVGTGVVNHELVGEAPQFTEGTRVWFWTLIEGGTDSEWIDHVWIHQGVEVGRVPLKVGGASWRTKSYKDLNPGSKGNWIVEARDKAGRVLARRQFSCSAQD